MYVQPLSVPASPDAVAASILLIMSTVLTRPAVSMQTFAAITAGSFAGLRRVDRRGVAPVRVTAVGEMIGARAGTAGLGEVAGARGASGGGRRRGALGRGARDRRQRGAVDLVLGGAVGGAALGGAVGLAGARRAIDVGDLRPLGAGRPGTSGAPAARSARSRCLSAAIDGENS